jgi:bacteriorhodopsin
MDISFLELAAQYSFWLGFSAMAGGVLYFALERQSLAVEYQLVGTLSAAVALVAAINYFYMKGQFDIGEAGQFAQFPTHFRYVDWLLTTPMLLAIIPILIGLKEGTKGLMTQLIIADLIMIVAGYVGETSINAELGGTLVGWLFFFIAVAAFIFILFTLYATLSSAEQNLPARRAESIGTLKIFISLGWLIYPLGFLMALIWDGAAGGAMRELIYNVADIITKVGFGIVAVAAAKQASYVPIEQPQAAE